MSATTRAPREGEVHGVHYHFIDDATFLDGQYTVWGVVTEGMDHIDALPKGEPPRAPGKIVSMKVAADA